jgi:arginyl-tRNA synthetase
MCYVPGVALGLDAAVITRCGNPAFGDFQCNNAMSLSKHLKTLEGFTGSVSPKDIADRISFALPINPITSGTSSVVSKCRLLLFTTG